MIVDTHIHLSLYKYNDEFPYWSMEDNKYLIKRGKREQLIEEFKSSGIGFCIDPAISIASNENNLALATQYPGYIYASVGVHPKSTYSYVTIDEKGKRESTKLHWKQRKLLEQYIKHESVVAIGETGLDYSLKRSEQHRFIQKIWFIWQLRLAKKNKLPIILHVRDSHDDAIRILRMFRNQLHGGVCHCFCGDEKTAALYTDLGLKLGIGGALLNGKGKNRALEDAVRHTPLESILIETDGPYVKPDCEYLIKKKMRAARNTSLILPEIVKRIAELKDVSVQEVEQITTANAEKLFNIKANN